MDIEQEKKVIIFGDQDSGKEAVDFLLQQGIAVEAFIYCNICPEIPFVKKISFDNKKLKDVVQSGYILVASRDPKFIVKVRGYLASVQIAADRICDQTIVYSEWMTDILSNIAATKKVLSQRCFWHILRYASLHRLDAALAIEKIGLFIADQIRSEVKHGTKIVAVYCPGKAYRKNIGSREMYAQIAKQGYNVIFLFGVVTHDEFEKRENAYYVGHDLIKYLRFIDIFVLPTLMLGLPENSIKVLFLHDIYDSPLGKEWMPQKDVSGRLKESSFLDSIDYIFAPSRWVMPGDKRPEVERSRPLCYIPGGYPKIDFNIKYAKEHIVVPDSIVYAPTVIDDEFKDFVSLPLYGRKIIEVLLQRFSANKIIFRPHPHTLQSSFVKDIVQEFAGNERFILDDDASFYMSSYSRSMAMVTDMSGTGFTYAFTFLRPVIFFSHNDAQAIDSLGDLNYFKDRSSVGNVVFSIDDLAETVADSIKDTKRISKGISKLRSKVIFNIEKSEKYFIENFHYIASQKINHRWKYIHNYDISLKDHYVG